MVTCIWIIQKQNIN